MPTYDFRCANCKLVAERHLTFAEFDNSVYPPCDRCGTPLEMLFSPTNNIIPCPAAFKQTFGEQFGTSSEKDWHKENPGATRINPSTFRTRRQQDEARWSKARKDAADVEHALKANATLAAPAKKKKKQKRSA